MGVTVSEIMNKPVSGYMSKKLHTVLPTDSLAEVHKIFEEHNIHHVPVVRGLKLVGIVSKTDYLKAFHSSRLEDPAKAAAADAEMLGKFKVEDLMTKHVVKVSDDDKLGVAAEIFLENYIHAVPVVNANEELVGIVTSYDVLYACFKGAYPTQEIERAH